MQRTDAAILNQNAALKALTEMTDPQISAESKAEQKRVALNREYGDKIRMLFFPVFDQPMNNLTNEPERYQEIIEELLNRFGTAGATEEDIEYIQDFAVREFNDMKSDRVSFIEIQSRISDITGYANPDILLPISC